MASITIRKLDEKTKARLRVRAAQHGRSMEEEARTLLRSALRTTSSRRATWPMRSAPVSGRFGGVGLRLPAREPIREPPKPGR